MNDTEAKQIFDTVIRGHWENWPSGAEEVYVWVRALKPFDFNIARDAINDFYANWKSDRYPKMAGIVAAIRRYARTQHRHADTVKHYTIMRANGRRRWFPFWGRAGLPRQDIEEDASNKLAQAMIAEPDSYILWPHTEEAVPF